MTTFVFTADTQATERLAKVIGQIPEALTGRVIVTSLNAVAERTYDLSRRRITEGVNLTDDYLRRRMVVRPATVSKPEAVIEASGAKSLMTQLSHYDAQQAVQPVTWNNARILGMGKKFGKWPGWTERIGRPSLGIQPNDKAAGRSAEVNRGTRRLQRSAFALPGRKDSEGNYLIFRRNNGKITSLLGPSVYQLFRYQIPLIENEIMADLEQELLDNAQTELQKALDG